MATLLPQVCSLVDICSNLQFSSINVHARKQIQNNFHSHCTTTPKYVCTAFGNKRNRQSTVRSSLVISPREEELSVPSEKKVYDVILKQAALVKRNTTSTALNFRPDLPLPGSSPLLTEAYHRSGMISEAYAKTFHLGTLLLTPEKRRAIWAIGVWCRRTDELVDGPNALYTTHLGLEKWESRLDDIFAGRPYDMYDAALCDTIARFPMDIQLFKDLIEGMRTDLRKSRYENFDELYLYSYYASGTVGMIILSVMGIAPESKAPTESVYSAAVSLGVALQLTNILRDIGEDARRGRIYLPQDELAQAGLSDEDIFKGKVTDRWRDFMKNQIKRARMFFKKTQKGLTEYNPDSRWPIWSIFLMYRQILDEIEKNDYNSFTKKACVSTAKKLFLGLPVAYGKSLMLPASIKEANLN